MVSHCVKHALACAQRKTSVSLCTFFVPKPPELYQKVAAHQEPVGERVARSQSEFSDRLLDPVNVDPDMADTYSK